MGHSKLPVGVNVSVDGFNERIMVMLHFQK